MKKILLLVILFLPLSIFSQTYVYKQYNVIYNELLYTELEYGNIILTDTSIKINDYVFTITSTETIDLENGRSYNEYNVLDEYKEPLVIITEFYNNIVILYVHYNTGFILKYKARKQV